MRAHAWDDSRCSKALRSWVEVLVSLDLPLRISIAFCFNTAMLKIADRSVGYRSVACADHGSG